jgi:cytochrome c oxidase assembly protein subunit 15
MRRLAVANLVAQIGITVTGATVRVTGSGLGCPGWPECFPGSLVPVRDAEVAALHQWVEFGNRLLTFVLVAVAGLCLVAALHTRPRRRRLTVLAAAMPAGVVLQAAIGGVTVLADLSWSTVSVHFLVSSVLIWLSVGLVAAADAGGGSATPTVPPALRGLVATSTGVLAALLATGTLVTAAGPHAGDADVPRLALGVETLAQLHAELLFGYVGILVGLGFALCAVAAPATVMRRHAVLVAVVLAQGALGGIQYVLGVPEALVVLHVLGAGLTTAAAAALWFATTVVGPVPATPRTPPEPVLADRG